MKRPREDDVTNGEHQLKKTKKSIPAETSSRKRKNDTIISLQPCKKMKLTDNYLEDQQYRRDILLYL